MKGAALAWARARIVLRLLRGIVLGLLAAVLLYGCTFLTTGAITVNRDFVPADGGVPIWVFASTAHSDLILPLRHPVHDWTEDFPPTDVELPGACYTTHIVIGWGNRGFYLDVRDWANLTAAAAFGALLYLDTAVIHVEHMWGGIPLTNDEQRGVVISGAQYRRLVEFVRASLVRDRHGRTRKIAVPGYRNDDAFYAATGRYGLFYTCNTWTNQALRHAGVPTSLWAVFPNSLLPHLPAL